MEEDKKAERKRKRFAARLKSSKGIDVVETPGRNIVLCNAGQATGFEKISILNFIKENALNIPPPKYVAEKGESHSFLIFSSSEDAILFYNACNGRGKSDEKGTPLYMSFVENVPDLETICPHAHPKGLTILNDFITKDEERNFLNIFNWTTEDSNLKNRQVKHYGYEFRYGTNDVDLNNPLDEKIPEECELLWRRLEEHGLKLGVPDQLTVNKYCPGQGIPSHVDRHSPFGSTILSLSLSSAVVMEWKHHTGKLVPVVVPSRSMLVMQDEARYDWQHGIQPRTFDPIIEQRTINNKPHKVITTDTRNRQMRISLTFRWTRRGPCECGYKTLCDSLSNEREIDERLASNLEELHVHQVYEQIAGHFSSTRHTPWPRVVEFLQTALPGDLVLDLGAGNGKNILRRWDIMQIACERSSGLVSECATHITSVPADCMRLDMLYAPLREGIADKVICIAVIHHFTTTSRRLQALTTIHQLLRPSGLALITVWAKDQTKSNYLCKNKVPTENDRLTVAGVTLPVHENRTQFQHQDLLVPWKLRLKTNNKLENTSQSTLLRYYHVFEETELDELCKEVGFVIEHSFYEEGNWCVICKKL